MKQGSFQISAGKVTAAFERAVRKAAKDSVIQKIMKRRPGVFTSDAKVRKLIANRLGWVDSAATMKRQVGNIEKFGGLVISSGIRHVVLMGMGGSSLCPELFKLVHRKHPRLKSFDVIDSTDPQAVKAVASKIEPKKTLFVVASKSGGTVETRSHEAFFTGLLKEAKVRNIGRHFVAITDKGSGLEKSARKNKYRRIFLNPADIGGRYSALSYFGLVPGFFAGVDLRALLDDAVMMQKLLLEREGELNPALALGSLMAAAAREGRDKLTFIASKRTTPLVPWIEQLVAESTGKKKKGVVPIENEPIGEPKAYKDDRLFVFLRMTRERTPETDKLKAVLKKKRFPVIEITLGSPAELGRQFLLWEAATAVTGYHFKINPFDEPNVTESKNNTNDILAGFERSGEFPDQHPHSRWGKLWLVAYEKNKKYRMTELNSFRRFLKRFLSGARKPRYLATLNYFKADRRTEAALEKVRREVRDRTGMATLRGYGPRFLHSIGQLYKGGPAEGMFVVFVKASYGRLPIPGRIFDFGQLIAAQAIGDSQALMKRKLPTLVIAIDGNPADGLEVFARAVKAALK
ncbi:MAG: glucose-6-phosphate isomerase [bacterium]|nr:glucose-6-phosphate isomerase [bacterium]